MKAILMIISLAFVSVLNPSNIHEAAKNGDIERVKSLIETNKQLVNEKDNEGDIPLCTSILYGQTEVSLFFIEKGADINNQNQIGYTPLHWAAIRRDTFITKALINKGANPNIKSTEGGSSPLHMAGERGSIEIVKLLIELGASLEIKDAYGRTPLTITARQRDDIDLIKTFVENGANINATDMYGDSPLSLAAWRGYKDIVNYLLEKQVIVHHQGETGISLMKYAINKKLWNLYQKIISNGGDLSNLCPKGITLLHIAAKGGSDRITTDLINKGIDVNDTDIYGYTPIHYAAKYGRLAVIKILVNNGANINAKTKLGETPINSAKRENQNDVVDFLISCGGDQKLVSTTNLKGQYFGQKKSGKTPELFAPGIVSNFVGGHSSVVFSPDGKEAIWTEWNETEEGFSDGCTVWYTKVENGYWKLPEKLLKFGDSPVYSTDGKKIYFMASIPQGEGQHRKNQIMYFEKENNTLSEPKLVDFNLAETGLYWQFTFDKDQNIYFGGKDGLCKSTYKEGIYELHEKLINIFHPDYRGESPYISPNGTYIIFTSKNLPNSIGGHDLYIGFKKPDGTWTKPKNMGSNINTPDTDMLPMVTLDGEYLFFKSKRDGISGIYWVSTKIIEELKPEESK